MEATASWKEDDAGRVGVWLFLLGPTLALATMNTVLLLTSSYTMVGAGERAGRGDRATVGASLLRHGRIFAVALALAVAAALAGCGSRPPEVLAQLPEFTMTAVGPNAESPFGRAEMEGRVWVVDFIFTRCTGPCPVLTGNLAALGETLPAEVGMLSVSVDPEGDTPPRLRAYANRFGADPHRWVFLRGTVEDTYRVMYAVFRQPMSMNPNAPEGRRVMHSTRFVLVDREGAIRGFYDGLGSDSNRLVRDARSLLEPAPSS